MPLKIHRQGVTVNVRLTPGARQDGISGIIGQADGSRALKISVRAPPENGRANKELFLLLAKAWHIPKSSLSLLTGDTSRQKTVLVEGEAKALYEKLSNWLKTLG